MNPWSLRCSKLALGKTKFLFFLQILIQGVHGQGKSQREITFFKAKELSGIFDISQHTVHPDTANAERSSKRGYKQ